MRLRKANRNRLKAHTIRVLREAFDFDMAQIARMSAMEPERQRRALDRRARSGFIVRYRRRMRNSK